MPEESENKLTDLSRYFLEPSNTAHRQYEALRAYFVEGIPSHEAARRFGYTPGSFRVLCHQFRRDPGRPFFLAPSKGRRPGIQDARREQIIAWRKKNLSVYDISEALGEAGHGPLSPGAVSRILKQEGFAPLPRRRDEERPPKPRPAKAPVADVRRLDLAPRRFQTKFGGLFLFLPDLAALPLSRMLQEAGLPGSEMVPAQAAVRSLLALKLFGNARHSHVMSQVFDQGPALFAGLNCLPKRSFLTEYSCRIDPAAHPRLRRLWFQAAAGLGLPQGDSFDLDFHTIPFHGEQALLQKHYVSKRSRRQKGVLAFLASDAEARVFRYANSQVRKEDQSDEILRFAQEWKQRTGKLPQELIFDSKLTTYANLNRLNEMGIGFITLRRRSRRMLEQARLQPLSAWRRIRLDRVTRAFRSPRILDRKVGLRDYQGPVRQLVVDELGHDDPTFLLTNQLRRSPAKLIERYAQRMIIENQIADGIDFFHMDALSSAVPMKTDCDLMLTLMASSLYRLLGIRLANGYAQAKCRHIFRDFIDAAANVEVSRREVRVRFQKRAHNPLLLAAGYASMDPALSWLGGKRLRLLFGEPA